MCSSSIGTRCALSPGSRPPSWAPRAPRHDWRIPRGVQVLVEQQLLTTERTRALMLQLLPEGESAAAWERALKALVAAAAEDDEMNCLLWQELKAQVRDRAHWQRDQLQVYAHALGDEARG